MIFIVYSCLGCCGVMISCDKPLRTPMIFIMYRVVLHGSHIMVQVFAHTRDISNVAGCIAFVILSCDKSLRTPMIYIMCWVVLLGIHIAGQTFAHIHYISNIYGCIVIIS